MYLLNYQESAWEWKRFDFEAFINYKKGNYICIHQIDLCIHPIYTST